MLDVLAFGDHLKTPMAMECEHDENEIYQHFINCQDFLSFNSDETANWKSRAKLKKSMEFLKGITEQGDEQAQHSFLEKFFGHVVRAFRTTSTNECMKQSRAFSAGVAQSLVTEKGKTQSENAAIMLMAAVEVTNKSILMVSHVSL